ncbi:transcriptional regulator [Sulfuricella sp. T08]|uniref:RNA-binding domain-containing protein n=1 Tax=Sulfuricella sp. T08 TaxID=1632857 RepID=UPI0006179E8A|nr:RNA-binding domain-containing protein [Sulfuricella sp. T08]GAO37297.1 transcriptional regulator [Sulfuricella sp. T08]
MNEAELNTLLDCLLALPVETEWVEFKEAKQNFDSDDLGKYFSALSNEANLHRQPCAWLVFGVKDKPRQVVGSQFRNNPVSLQSLKQEVSTHLSPNLTFVEVHVLQRPEGRVLLFQIPSAPAGMPVSWKMLMYGRNGESLAGLSIEKIERIRRQATREDWSAELVPNAGMDDIDATALALGRQKYREKHESNARLLAEEAAWDGAKFLDKLKLRTNGQLTRAALLLFGKDEAAGKLPTQPKISWILKDAQGMDVDYQHFGLPLLMLPDALFARVRNLTVRYMPPGTLFPTEVPQYDNWVIREALHNCLAHQDYAMGGLVRVVEKPGELIFSNLGNFLPGSVEEVIAQDVPPEEYRNPCLANAMVEMKLIDTIGSGIRRMFVLQRNRFFPLPDYLIDRERSRVEAHIAGRLIDERYTFALIRHADLTLHEVILLDRVQKRLAITADEVKLLRGKNLIEGRAPNFFVAAGVAAAVGDAAQYTRNKGLDKAFYKQLVISHLRSFGPTRRKDIELLLLPKLPEVLHDSQKINKVRNLLQEMAKENVIVSSGYGVGAIWSLIPA